MAIDKMSSLSYIINIIFNFPSLKSDICYPFALYLENLARCFRTTSLFRWNPCCRKFAIDPTVDIGIIELNGFQPITAMEAGIRAVRPPHAPRQTKLFMPTSRPQILVCY